MPRPQADSRTPLVDQASALIRDGRVRLAMTTVDLAERSGVSRQMISDLEHAIANPTLETLEKVFRGLDLDIEFIPNVRPVVLGGSPRQRDAAHAILSGYVQRRLVAAGFLVRREVRIDSGRYHGWIDLLAFHPGSGTLLVIEIKTVIDDLGGIERTLDWYAREARGVAATIGWQAKRVVPWLLVLATDDVDGQVRANRDAINAAFPMRAAAMADLLADPASASSAGRGIALVDPRSRRRVWLIRSRLDGRRSDAPYRGYADFMDPPPPRPRHRRC